MSLRKKTRVREAKGNDSLTLLITLYQVCLILPSSARQLNRLQVDKNDGLVASLLCQYNNQTGMNWNTNQAPRRIGKDDTQLRQRVVRISVEQLEKENQFLRQLVYKRRSDQDALEGEVTSLQNEVIQLESQFQILQQRKWKLLQPQTRRTRQLQSAQGEKRQLENELMTNRLKAKQVIFMHQQSDKFRIHKIQRLEKQKSQTKSNNQDLQKRLNSLRSEIQKKSMQGNTLHFKIIKFGKQKVAYETSARQNNTKYQQSMSLQLQNKNRLQQQYQRVGIELHNMVQELAANNKSCFVCQDQERQANRGLYPCGHIGFCATCLPLLKGICPKCRAPIVRAFEFNTT